MLIRKPTNWSGAYRTAVGCWYGSTNLWIGSVGGLNEVWGPTSKEGGKHYESGKEIMMMIYSYFHVFGPVTDKAAGSGNSTVDTYNY